MMKTGIEIKNNSKEDAFVLIEASRLSINDDFLRYEAETEEEQNLKENIIYLINEGISDFYCQKLDPSLNDDGQIIYAAGNRPAVNQTYSWWLENAEQFWPERNSRLGNDKEYTAFLGVLIKKMIISGEWSKAEAWKAVCLNSQKLGHFKNSYYAMHEFENTGSRRVFDFFDLANTSKILTSVRREHCMINVSGCYNDDSREYPLGEYSYLFIKHVEEAFFDYSVGWLVLEK